MNEPWRFAIKNLSKDIDAKIMTFSERIKELESKVKSLEDRIESLDENIDAKY